MERHLSLSVHNISAVQSEELLAYLSEMGFEGFEELSDRLIAYRPEGEWEKDQVCSYLKDRSLGFSFEWIEKTNWNHLWESNFEPVRVDDFVGIRADFHPSFSDVQYDLVITPKMSFGTGHHATTRLMLQRMRDTIKSGDRVLDFGTGTGVLAILAKKMGAGLVIGIDVEDWSVENAIENAKVNQVPDIIFHCSDHIRVDGPFDRILANINRNILLDHMRALQSRLAPGGLLLLSGILEEDLPVMENSLREVGLHPGNWIGEKGWICIQAVNNQ